MTNVTQPPTAKPRKTAILRFHAIVGSKQAAPRKCKTCDIAVAWHATGIRSTPSTPSAKQNGHYAPKRLHSASRSEASRASTGQTTSLKTPGKAKRPQHALRASLPRFYDNAYVSNQQNAQVVVQELHFSNRGIYCLMTENRT